MIMIVLLPAVLVLGLLVFLFFREIKHDRKRFYETKRFANEHVLREVELFLKENRVEPKI